MLSYQLDMSTSKLMMVQKSAFFVNLPKKTGTFQARSNEKTVTIKIQIKYANWFRTSC